VKTYSASPSLRLASSRTTISTVTIADSYAIYDLNVQLNITQVNDSALQSVTLTAPDGTVVPLFASVGGTGSNFTNTTLDDAAAKPIGSGVAPFTGTFRPQSLLDVLDGKNLHGTWTLSLTEGSSTGKNVLNSWSLIVTGPKPPGAAMSMRLTAAGGPGSLSGSRSLSNRVAPGTLFFDQALGMANPDLASGPTAPDVALPLARPRVRWSPRRRPFGQP
jgi:subtilisin-like proprotein convertase family protein